MRERRSGYYAGERALFGEKDLKIYDAVFADGESPLKESENIALFRSAFKWKYPLWYSKGVTLEHCVLHETARAGIWYTSDVTMRDCLVEAPKTFRRASDIKLENVTFPHAEETLWACRGVVMKNVSAKGDYFAMNSEDMEIDGFSLSGNYPFDGAKNVTIRGAKLLSKDAFWNSENVTVYDSYISGEYLGWNAKNLTFVNCTIESLQGLCYIENLVMKNCKLLHTTLAFEYSTVHAEVEGKIDSVLNPAGGEIAADEIGELTLEGDKIDPAKTVIRTARGELYADGQGGKNGASGLR